MKAEDMTEDIYKSGSFFMEFKTELSFEEDTKIYNQMREFAKGLSEAFGVEIRTQYIPETKIVFEDFN